MSTRPFVSVAMAAYNADRFVETALSGILAQSRPVDEVVVCDDGSSDGTPTVLARLQAHDARIRVLRNDPNQGGYRAMNRAMDETRGEFVALYHADDVYGPEIVARQVAFLEAHPEVGAVFTLDRFLDESGRPYGALTVPDEVAGVTVFDGPTLTRAILRHRNSFLVTPTVMFRREAWEEVGEFDHERFGIAADLDLWLRLSLRWKVGLIHEHLMGYRHYPLQWSRVYARSRVEPDLSFAVLDAHLSRPGVREAVDSESLTRYKVHQARDNAERAANLLQLGERRQAVAVLDRVFVRPLLGSSMKVEVVRVLALRTLVRAAARMGGGRLARGLVFAARFRRLPPAEFAPPDEASTHTLGGSEGVRASGPSGPRSRPDVAVFLDPFSKHFYGDGIFSHDSRLNRDGALRPWFHLREALAERGIPIRTADYLDEPRYRGRLNVYVSFGIVQPPERLLKQDLLLNAFYLFEAPAVDPAMYRAIPGFQDAFRKVYAWTDADSLRYLVPEPLRLTPFRIPMPHEGVIEPCWSRGGRSGTVMVSGNKTATVGDGELYTERLRVLAHLAPHGSFDLWGRGWDRGLGDREAAYGEAVRACYRGETADKFDTISRYRTAICYENQVLGGWITEKIFDCFYAGTVPVYLGAPDIEDHIPKETFIDRRDFSDDEELRRYLEGVGEEELEAYRVAARDFLGSSAFEPFAPSTFSRRMIEDVEAQVATAGGAP